MLGEARLILCSHHDRLRIVSVLEVSWTGDCAHDQQISSELSANHLSSLVHPLPPGALDILASSAPKPTIRGELQPARAPFILRQDLRLHVCYRYCGLVYFAGAPPHPSYCTNTFFLQEKVRVARRLMN